MREYGKNQNIIKSFIIRTVIAMIILSGLSSLTILNYQQYKFYNSLKNEIKVRIDKALEGYDTDLRTISKETQRKHAKMIFKSLDFISLEVYDEKKQEIVGLTTNNKKYIEEFKILKNYDDLIIHNFPKSRGIEHNYFEINGKYYFLQIFYPIYRGDLLLGYVEGIKHLNPSMISEFKERILMTTLLVIGTIFLFGMIIFPLIVLAYKQLKEKQKELIINNIMTINTLGNAIALRDSDTNEHNFRVTLYAIALASEIDLANEQMQELIIGAFLHDVGKIGVADAILLKNGKLTDDEFKVMQEHVLKGIDIINGNAWLENARDIIIAHHEKYDGTGYPHQLKGEKIPYIARIFAIVDVFDALTSKRPYKEPFSYEKTVSILQESSGTHFDAKLLESFFSISKELYETIPNRTNKELKDRLEECIKRYFLTLNIKKEDKTCHLNY